MPGAHDDHLVALRATPLFAALDETSLASLAGRCRVLLFAAGRVVFLAGQEADRFYVVLRGRVKVFQVSAKGDEQILHLYGPGKSFAEAAMWSGGTFPAAAQAVEDTRLLEVSRKALREAIEANVDLAMGMLAGLSGKLREFTVLIEDLSLRDVPARAARALLAEADRAGADEFQLRQTKRELAGQIGTAAETLSRALAKLKAAGVISVKGSRITLHDPAALRALAEGRTADGA